jgi:hypothetical protein
MMFSKRSIVRPLLLVLAFALGGALTIAPAHAKTDFGVRGGGNSETESPFLGAEALFQVGSSHQWYGNPNLEHAFADNDHADLTSVSFDFHYDFPSGQPYTIWAGGGPTVIHRDSTDTSNEKTDPGVNLLFGIGAKKGDVRPYGQMKVVVAQDSEAVLGVGVRF